MNLKIKENTFILQHKNIKTILKFTSEGIVSDLIVSDEIVKSMYEFWDDLKE